MKEKPDSAITGALRKQNILREAQGQSRPPAKVCRSGRWPRNRPSRHSSATAEEADGVAPRPPALPGIRLEAEDSGQFLCGIPEGEDDTALAENPSRRHRRLPVLLCSSGHIRHGRHQ